MKYKFILQEMIDTLESMGMDEDPWKAGYIDQNLEDRDGQRCDVIEWQEHNEITALVKWEDGTIEKIAPHGGLVLEEN